MKAVVNLFPRLCLALSVSFVAWSKPSAALAAVAPIQFGLTPEQYAAFDQFSPTGAHLLFCVVPNSGTGLKFIEVVDAATQAAIKLFESDSFSCSLTNKVFTPDEQRLFFLAPATGNTDKQLWRATTDGAQVTASVSGRAPAGYEVSWFELSPDGLWVVYDIRHIASAMNYVEHQLGLYIAPTDGSAPARALAIQPTDPAKYVIGQGFTPDSAMYLYTSDQDGAAYQWNLYAVAVDGQSTPRRLTPQPCAESALSYYQCHGPITRDSQDAFLSLSTSSATGLYRVSLNSSSATWRFVRNTRGDQLVLNDTRILAYTTTNITTMPVDGSSAPQDAVVPLPSGAQSPTGTPGNSPTSATACMGACRVVPWFGPNSNAQWIYRIALDGVTPAQPLFAAPGAGTFSGSRITRMSLTRDKTQVFFEVANEGNTLAELYVLPVDGSASAHRVASWVTTFAGMTLWAPLADGRYVAVVDLTPDPHAVQVVDSTVVDGPRLPGPSVGFLGGMAGASPSGREVLVSGSAGWFLVDALTSVLPNRLYLASLRR